MNRDLRSLGITWVWYGWVTMYSSPLRPCLLLRPPCLSRLAALKAGAILFCLEDPGRARAACCRSCAPPPPSRWVRTADNLGGRSWMVNRPAAAADFSRMDLTVSAREPASAMDTEASWLSFVRRCRSNFGSLGTFRCGRWPGWGWPFGPVSVGTQSFPAETGGGLEPCLVTWG